MKSLNFIKKALLLCATMAAWPCARGVLMTASEFRNWVSELQSDLSLLEQNIELLEDVDMMFLEQPIGVFPTEPKHYAYTGIFNGQGHKLYNIFFRGEQGGFGLFAKLVEATV